MEDLCPLCLKNGAKKKVKLLQINLHEAVWMCEEEKCPWPFGYKGFIFCPRIVGKIWSCYWDDHKPTAELKEAVLSPINQHSFCNSPATLTKTVSTDCDNTLNLIANHLENINSPTKVNSGTDDSQTFLYKKSETFTSNNEDNYANDTRNTNDSSVINNSSQLVNNGTKNMEIKNECINTSKKIFQKEEDSCKKNNSIVINNSSQLVNDKTDNTEMKNECINISKKILLKNEDSCTQNNLVVTSNSLQLANNEARSAKMENECLNTSEQLFQAEKVSCPQNNKNVNVIKIPKITSIKKTNINIVKIKRNQILLHQDKKEELSTEKSTDVGSKKYLPNDLSVSDKLVNSGPAVNYSCDKKFSEIKSNINITKVEVDGLPPITLSFEVPTCATISKSIVSHLENSFDNVACSNTKFSTPTTKDTLVKRETGGKQYEKFSFSKIKKQLQTNNSSNINNGNNKMTNNIENKSSGKINQSNKTIKTHNSNSERFNISTNNSHKNMSQHTSPANNSINIDTVLDDLLSNDCSISEEINDDWINSLLT
ncbi:uncharacterized protein LOC144468604 [Augochlora pura]